MQSEFLKQCDQLTAQLNKLEVSKNVALEQIKNCSEDLRVLVDKLNSIDIPVVNGEKVIDLNIDTTKLGSYQYIHELNTKLPLMLEKLETVGIDLISKVNI